MPTAGSRASASTGRSGHDPRGMSTWRARARAVSVTAMSPLATMRSMYAESSPTLTGTIPGGMPRSGPPAPASRQYRSRSAGVSGATKRS
jgi:hypothetical protein